MSYGEVRLRFPMTGDTDYLLDMLEEGCRGCVLANVSWIMRSEAEGGSVPCCLPCSGVRYEDPPKCSTSCQFLDTAPVLLDRGRATCYSIACFVAAKYIASGQDARVVIEPIRNAYGSIVEGEFHAVVHGPNGREDPTLEVINGKCAGGPSCTGSNRKVDVGGCGGDPASPYGGNCVG